MYETDKEYAFELEVPGFEERELTVEVSDRTLAVEGERTEAKDERKKEYRLRERLENAFERRFELPPEADPKSVGAEFAKGVLVVHAAKLEAAEPRKVEIADTR
ncbi:MAG: Hsp20/alpha crystallin family protein [Gaiellaceae bacterium]